MASNAALSQVRAAAGRIGGLAKAGRFNPQELTAPARQGFMRRFYEEVDARNPGLSEKERERRVRALLRAHMAKLALKSAQARKGGTP